VAGTPANDVGPVRLARSRVKIVGAIVAGDEALVANAHHPLGTLTPDQRRVAARRALGRLVVFLAGQPK
jgi:hypothetical protein